MIPKLLSKRWFIKRQGREAIPIKSSNAYILQTFFSNTSALSEEEIKKFLYFETESVDRLHASLRTKDLKTTKELIQNGVDIEGRIDMFDETGYIGRRSPINTAIKADNEEGIIALIEGGADLSNSILYQYAINSRKQKLLQKFYSIFEQKSTISDAFLSLLLKEKIEDIPYVLLHAQLDSPNLQAIPDAFCIYFSKPENFDLLKTLLIKEKNCRFIFGLSYKLLLHSISTNNFELLKIASLPFTSLDNLREAYMSCFNYCLNIGLAIVLVCENPFSTVDSALWIIENTFLGHFVSRNINFAIYDQKNNPPPILLAKNHPGFDRVVKALNEQSLYGKILKITQIEPYEIDGKTITFNSATDATKFFNLLPKNSFALDHNNKKIFISSVSLLNIVNSWASKE